MKRKNKDEINKDRNKKMKRARNTEKLEKSKKQRKNT